MDFRADFAEQAGEAQPNSPINPVGVGKRWWVGQVCRQKSVALPAYLRRTSQGVVKIATVTHASNAREDPCSSMVSVCL